MADLAGYFRDLVGGRKKKVRDRFLLALLRLLSHPYRFALILRSVFYRCGLFRSHRLPRPVISVGNITLGGTGKTPMVAYVAAKLIASGKRVAVLSRGYGGSAGKGPCLVSDGTRILVPPGVSGDEPHLLARKVPGLAVLVGSDRHRAGVAALEEINPDVFLLDDGFQHLRLQRDLDILLLDAAKPFANGYTLPAGYLRESVSAADRADLVVYTRSPRGEAPHLFPGIPSCWSSHRIAGLAPLEGGERWSFDRLRGERITAFSGIADPTAFFDLLEEEGVKLTATLSFEDHVRYGEEEIAAICRLKGASRSAVLITTEKDAVKLAPYAERLGLCLTALLEIRFHDCAALDAALEKVLY